MNKKGSELSLNTVIIAIILIIVLVVVIYIFMTRSGRFSHSVDLTCGEQGGIMATRATDCPLETYFTIAPTEDRKSTTGCCIPVKRTGQT